MLFDAHIHAKNHEHGGFMIGTEGKPKFDGTLDNEKVLALHDPSAKYISFYYVAMKEITYTMKWPFLKYHPRREGYTPSQVKASIRKNKPNAVIIDTLNEPFWSAYDYWSVARENLNTTIVFAHAGGYLINEFIKICHFQPNTWLDFSCTQTILGHLGDANNGLPYINEAIRYALHSYFNNRILMASDYPFFNQDDVFDYYTGYHDLLNVNFVRLMEMIK